MKLILELFLNINCKYKYGTLRVLNKFIIL